MTKTVTGHKKGLLAEMRAAVYLRFKGYKVLETRFKTPVGEVDLIAEKAGVLVFVEVKLRKTEAQAAESIHKRNQKRVTDAAQLYLQKHPEYNGHDMRFDALIFSGAADVMHIENAWGQ